MFVQLATFIQKLSRQQLMALGILRADNEEDDEEEDEEDDDYEGEGEEGEGEEDEV